MDESFRAIAIEDNTTAEQLKSIVVEKIGLKEELSACFSIFEKKDGWGKLISYQ